MRLSELMTPQVQMVQETASIEDAAKLMKEQDIGALPVFNKDRLVGMITDRDIAAGVGSAGRRHTARLGNREGLLSAVGLRLAV